MNTKLIFTHFLYCIKHIKDNRYILLNTAYNRLGETKRYDDYDSHPSVFRAKITPKLASSLSYKHSNDVECIYLYDTRTQALEDDTYFKKLKIISKIGVTID
jgi:hypothetical protein